MLRNRIIVFLCIWFLGGRLASQHRLLPEKLEIDSVFKLEYATQFDTAEITKRLAIETIPDRRYGLLAIQAANRMAAEQYSSVLKPTTEALTCLPTSRRNYHAAWICYFHGLALHVLNRPVEAIRSYQVSDSLCALSGEFTLGIKVKEFIGELHRSAARYEAALERIAEAEALAKEHNLPNDYLEAKCRSLSVFLQSHNSDQDTAYLSEASTRLTAIFAIPDLPTMYLAYVQGEAGMVALKRKQYARAKSYFEQSAQNALALGSMQDYCNQQINLFIVLGESGHLDEALQVGPKVLEDNARHQFTQRDAEVLSRLQRMAAKKGYFEQAYHYHLRWSEFERIHDSIAESTTVLELEKRYQSEKRAAELKISQEKVQQVEREKEAKVQQVFVWRLVAATVLALLVTVAILAFRTVRANNRARDLARQLQAQNQIITQNLEEKDILFKELHHRVKNNLQLLMSFMNLHHSHHKEITVKEFIATIEQKIRAMALVHEQLHQSNEVGRVMLKQYFQDIAENLLGAYGDTTQDVELHIEGTDIDLAIEEAIPMGLIVNEIITNSIKYAFPAMRKAPAIHLALGQAPDGHKTIVVSDNGVGFPTGFDAQKTKSIGSKVIVLLARQINASVEYFNQQGAVWKFQLTS